MHPKTGISTREDIARVIELAHQPVDAHLRGGLYLVELQDGAYILRHGDQLARTVA